MILKPLLHAIVRTTVTQIAVAALTWATDYKCKVVLIDIEEEVRDGDTVH